MKIMFCLGSMTKGGAERVVANLANDFIVNHKVSIVVTPDDKSHYDLNLNIGYYTLDNNSLIKENIWVRTKRRIKTLKDIITKVDPDIIVSLLPEPTYRVMFATFLKKRKVIISVRNDPKIEYDTFFKRLLMRFLYSRADGFIFQTEEAKSFFSKKIQKKSIVIPNPINDDFICSPYHGKRNKRIVTVGRLTPQKNHELLIEAFKEFVKNNKDYSLHIYGEGELLNSLQTKVKLLGIEEQVFFEGNVDNVKDCIYKSKMFVLSSDYEGMPNALMEAMALGIPCISTDCPCGGPAFLMKNKNNGILVPTNDKKALCDAMQRIATDEEYAKLIGNNANKIGKDLNREKINHKWIKYIEKIMKEK